MNHQLGTLGGGGSTRLTENDDVVWKKNPDNNDAFVYDIAQKKFVLQPMSTVPLFIQSTAPTTSAEKYLWIQTEIGANNDWSFWFEDGV